MLTRLAAYRCISILILPFSARAQGSHATEEWTAYGHDQLGGRFSPASQINRTNVSQLTPAWTYRTGEIDVPTRRPAKLETTPLMVEGTLYLSTPLGKVVALDPSSGAVRWKFETPINPQGSWGDFANRGVSTWLDVRAPIRSTCRRRIYYSSIDARIIALDARTGAVCRNFGAAGTVNLRVGLRNAPFELGEYQLTSPPAVIRGMIVTGSSVADNNRTNAASGEVRGYDARTGALRWSW
ncbi:MAG: PQQ-binding-like beta-propeller repeat protein, partial [Gemmatimonadaceae bacterium]